MRRLIQITALLALALATTPPAAARGDTAFAGVPNGCPAGATPLALTGVTVLPDGGKMDWYDGSGSPRVPVPPTGFEPSTASDDELALYGFPPRPVEPDALASWNAEMLAWKPTPDAGLCQLSQALGSAAMAAPSTTSTDWAHVGLNWSGYVAKQTTTTYIAVQGDYYQAAYHSSSCPNPLLWGSWTGLGGYWLDSGGIIQTGTAVSTSSSGTATYYAWTEVYPLAPKTWSQVVVHPGDHIHTYVVYQRSTGQTTMYVADDTTGTQKSEIETQPAKYYDGRTAEAIDERNTASGGTGDLLNFGTVGWFNLQVQKTSGTWYTLGSQTPEAQEIYSNSTKKILALPDAMSSSTAFTDRWYSCQLNA